MITESIDFINPKTFSESVGTVITTQNSPSTQRIDFVLNSTSENSIARGEILEIPTKNKLILGVITEIQKSNAYFSNADIAKDMSYTESSSDHLGSLFPTDEWATTVVTLKPMGYISSDSSKVQRIKYPISPGSYVYKARSDIIKQLLGLETSDKGLHLGTILTGKTPLYVSPTKLFQKHLAILAISGAGKSYATSVLIEELLIRSYDQGRLPVLIIDPHGEYKNFAQLLDKSSLATVYKGRHFSIQTNTLNAWSIREFSPDLSSVQVRELDKIIQALKKEKSGYSFKDIIEKVVKDDIPSRTKDSLLSWLDTLERTGLFGANAYPEIASIIKPGKISIFDLSDIQSIRQKQIICAYIARQAFFLRQQQKISPYLLIIEEAHQFCPENGLSISKNIIETIAREGRKFFASLCLISQRPVNLSSTALSQCNTHLIMRIRNPYDLDYIGKLSEGIDRETQKILPDLNVGEGILVGEAVNFPVLFKVRKKKLEIREKNEDLLKEISKYENK